MYKIIGADQREYGPCSADELRQWFREGRLNAQTMVQAVGSTEWKPFAAYPEFASLLSGAPSPTAPPTIGPTGAIPVRPAGQVPIAEIEGRDYDVDIFSCVSRAWNLMTRHFWPIVGISLLVWVAENSVSGLIEGLTGPSLSSQIIQAAQDPDSFKAGAAGLSPASSGAMGLSYLLSAPLKALLLGGLFRYYLKLIRGESAEMADAFSGFTLALVPLLLLGLVKSLLVGCGLLLCLVPGIYLAVAWAFSVPLLIDRRMDFWAAMELSRKVVSRHWFLILGLILVNSLIATVGCFLCCVTIPLAHISLMYAYEDIFGHRTTAQV